MKNKVHLLADTLLRSDNGQGVGLLHGQAGIVLALAYYKAYHAQSSKVKQLHDGIGTRIEFLFSALENQPLDASLGTGLAGIAFSLKSTSEMHNGEFFPPSYLKPIDQILTQSLLGYIDTGDYDLIRGGIGVLIYLLHYTRHEGALRKFISFLASQAVKYQDQELFWYTFSYHEESRALVYDTSSCNFGLAHGMAGIISSLADLYRHDVCRKQCLTLLSGAINFIASKHDAASVCGFPGRLLFKDADEIREPSKLAWCYGDAGIALALLKAGKYCGKKEWILLANQVGEVACARTIDNADLREHSLCHGYLGTMHLFNRLYLATGKSSYAKAMRYWRAVSAANLDYEISSTGLFQVDVTMADAEVRICHNGLLQGLAGNLLCLLSMQDGIAYPWDRAFLTNIEC
ncbi:hypothetical protein GCM10027594_11480 [Hymenobacter agri]